MRSNRQSPMACLRPMAYLSGFVGGLTLAAATPAFSHDRPPLTYIGSVAFQPEAGALRAGWTVNIAEDDLDRISFALNAAFGVASVSGPGTQSVKTELDARSGGAVRLYHVDLTPSTDGTDRVVKLAYGGPLFPEEPFMPINTLDPHKIELTVDSFWFPFDARFDSELLADVYIRIDGDWSAVGVDQTRRIQSGYHIRQSAPALDIAFSLLSDSQIFRSDGYVIHDARTEPGDKLPELKTVLESCTTYLNDLAGPAGPLPQASIIVTDRSDGAYARGTLISLTDIEGTGQEDLHQFICHELAHYWSRANAGGPENWINEGVADYLGNMAIRDALGEDVFDARMARYAEQLEGYDLPPIWAPDVTERPDYLTLYRAAPLVLGTLEDRMGRDAFAELMRAIMVEEVRTTPELLALIDRISGADIRSWFEAKLAE